jgi:hypothetical protein
VFKLHTVVQVHIFSNNVLQLRVTTTPDSSTSLIVIVNCFSVNNVPASVLLTLIAYVGFVSKSHTKSVISAFQTIVKLELSALQTHQTRV